MMQHSRQQSGFTAVELLITLFVAAAFLIASYQLFNLVIKDGGSTRAQSRAANVAYDYMRQYAASSTTIPCTASIPLNNAPVTIDGLSNTTITINISCLPDATDNISKVEAIITYNAPPQTIRYATYTNSSGASSSADITDGLVAWWKLNGDGNTAIGSPNGTLTNATSTANKDSATDMAYAFNGSSSSLVTNSTFGLGAANATISCWVYNPTATNSGLFVKVGSTTGYGIGIGGAAFDNSTPGTKIVMLFEGVRWAATTTNLGTGWHHVVMVIDAAGTPSAYLDGTLVSGSYAGTASSVPAGATTYVGGGMSTARYFNGSIDDVRLYNRALSLNPDITSLYSAGPK